jgi:hypothetical protein
VKTKLIDALLAIGLLAAVASGFAYTWAPSGVLVTYGSLGMSADGRIICAVPSGSHPVISTNWGNTWAAVTNNSLRGPLNLGGTAVSADGSKIIMPLTTNSISGPRSIFMSADYGASWTNLGAPSDSSSSAHLVACSADAAKLIVATGNGPIYFSTNAGANWLTSSVPNLNWVSLACSAGGQRMVAAVTSGKVYFSTNFGAIWTAANLPVEAWKSVCTSSDGQWIGATGSKSYISSNDGANWATNDFAGPTIVCSANGTNWLVTGTQVYTSSDGAVTWSANFSPGQWYGGTVSADGCEAIVEGGAAGTPMGRTVPSPQLSIQMTNPMPVISWLLPSTNFVLQQNLDLSTTNWLPISAIPTLNFTNLQQQVSVPAITSNAFFRLIAQ